MTKLSQSKYLDAYRARLEIVTRGNAGEARGPKIVVALDVPRLRREKRDGAQYARVLSSLLPSPNERRKRGGGARIYRRNSIIVGEHVGRARVFGPTANFAANEFTTRSTLSWTTEGINNVVKYFMDFAECGCRWCTVTSRPSVAIGPTSIVNGNKRALAGCEPCE